MHIDSDMFVCVRLRLGRTRLDSVCRSNVVRLHRPHISLLPHQSEIEISRLVASCCKDAVIKASISVHELLGFNGKFY